MTELQSAMTLKAKGENSLWNRKIHTTLARRQKKLRKYFKISFLFSFIIWFPGIVKQYIEIDLIEIQAILWKQGHAKGRTHIYERGRVKEEVKKVNMVDVLPIQEMNREFLNLLKSP
jgi:hypothetical protein